jgi:beta-lactamase class A
MLIELLGFEYLNSSFKDFGLKDTNIVRKMMDFRKRANGRENFTTASDMANLFKSMYYGRLINRDISKRCLLVLKKQKVKDRIPRKLPKGTMVAHKTGLERKICHDAGIIFTHSGGYLIVVLTKHRYKNSFPVKKFISQIALELYSYAQKS